VEECVPTGKLNVDQQRNTWILKSMKIKQAKKMASATDYEKLSCSNICTLDV
jgi:hypothetical protein